VRCGSEATRRDGRARRGGQRWRGTACRRRFTVRSLSAFSRHASSEAVIALTVRWYVRYRLSYADVAEWLAERGIAVDRSTADRRVQRSLPRFRHAARAYRHPVGDRWRVDETYCRLHGTWA
jgi:putative transposase